jgi:hypothetical protein
MKPTTQVDSSRRLEGGEIVVAVQLVYCCRASMSLVGSKTASLPKVVSEFRRVALGSEFWITGSQACHVVAATCAAAERLWANTELNGTATRIRGTGCIRDRLSIRACRAGQECAEKGVLFVERATVTDTS